MPTQSKQVSSLRLEYESKQATLMTRHDAKQWTILGCECTTALMAAPYAAFEMAADQ